MPLKGSTTPPSLFCRISSLRWARCASAAARSPQPGGFEGTGWLVHRNPEQQRCSASPAGSAGRPCSAAWRVIGRLTSAPTSLPHPSLQGEGPRPRNGRRLIIRRNPGSTSRLVEGLGWPARSSRCAGSLRTGGERRAPKPGRPADAGHPGRAYAPTWARCQGQAPTVSLRRWKKNTARAKATTPTASKTSISPGCCPWVTAAPVESR